MSAKEDELVVIQSAPPTSIELQSVNETLISVSGGCFGNKEAMEPFEFVWTLSNEVLVRKISVLGGVSNGVK